MNDFEYYYGDGKITPFCDTNIKDQRAIKFINSIKSRKLRQIVRDHFEKECFMRVYRYTDFRNEFIKYLNDSNNMYYFLPGLNDRYENILKLLLDV